MQFHVPLTQISLALDTFFTFYYFGKMYENIFKNVLILGLYLFMLAYFSIKACDGHAQCCEGNPEQFYWENLLFEVSIRLVKL